MTSPLTVADLSWVLLVTGADTPPEYQQYAGRVLGLPPDALLALGSGPTSPGELAGIWGYARASTVPAIAIEWVMSPRIPAAVVAQFNVLPGGDGWRVPASRDAFAGIGVALITTYDVPAVDTLGALQQLYAAARVEAIARGDVTGGDGGS